MKYYVYKANHTLYSKIKSIPDTKAITNLKIFNKMSTGKSMMSKYSEILCLKCVA